MSSFVTQNSFSRTSSSDACMGFYETDDEHMRSMSSFYDFQSPTEFLALEPSAGTGRAMRTMLAESKAAKVFMVELDRSRAAGLSERKEAGKDGIEAILNADFLSGIKATNSSFTFCFANPPYGEDVASKDRYEKLFAERIGQLMRPGGRLCYVIPFYVLNDPKFYRSFLSRFEVNYVYKFREPVYLQFKQVVLFATKRQKLGFTKAMQEEFTERIQCLQELPREWGGEKIPIPESFCKDIAMFSKITFDPEEGLRAIRNSRSANYLCDQLIAPKYTGNRINDPLIPLSQDMSKLLAISGAGQGFAGNLQTDNLHLQRGYVKRVKDSREVASEDGKSSCIVERSYASVGLNIIEQSGKITKF